MKKEEGWSTEMDITITENARYKRESGSINVNQPIVGFYPYLRGNTTPSGEEPAEKRGRIANFL
jgi:hypothetical protein